MTCCIWCTWSRHSAEWQSRPNLDIWQLDTIGETQWKRQPVPYRGTKYVWENYLSRPRWSLVKDSAQTCQDMPPHWGDVRVGDHNPAKVGKTILKQGSFLKTWTSYWPWPVGWLIFLMDPQSDGFSLIFQTFMARIWWPYLDLSIDYGYPPTHDGIVTWKSCDRAYMQNGFVGPKTFELL